MSESCVLPEFSLAQAQDALKDRFNLEGSLSLLNGERDLNYLLTTSDKKFIFKIANADEHPEMLDCQWKAFAHLQNNGVRSVPNQVLDNDGNGVSTIVSASGIQHQCRVLEFMEGELYSSINPQRGHLEKSLGRQVASITRGLTGFDHDALARPLLWKIEQAQDVVSRFTENIQCSERSQLLDLLQRQYLMDLNTIDSAVRVGTIHNDANDNNVLVKRTGPWQQDVVALIDFGDMVRGYLIADAAIAAAYACLDKTCPLDSICNVLQGFNEVLPVNESEISKVFPLVIARLCMSVSISAYQQSQNPENAYLAVSEQSAWHALRDLSQIPGDFAEAAIRQCCGFDPIAQNAAVVAWCQQHKQDFGKIVDVDFNQDKLLILDTSVGSPHISHPSDEYDVDRFSKNLFRAIEDNQAKAAIGLYNEYRLIYSNEEFRDFTAHHRTLHLGIDVFMEAGSAVYAPLAGWVHSVAFHNATQDYGGVVILGHEIEDESGSITFYTLYGHLGKDSIQHLSAGDPVSIGDRVGRMGAPDENGLWPPHVHFEVINNLLDFEDTFVGVGTFAYKQIWLNICPDPNLILNIPEQLLAVSHNPGDADSERILKSRKAKLAPSLSLSYREPLHIVRGGYQYLYDYKGYAYLDAVNNVPHVGHAHPHVAAAIQRQVSTLSTNTRYLYPQIEQYSELLLSHFPDPLNVCFLVNSGSEANDLALRLAWNYTHRRDVMVIDHAYHGNLSALIDISPYKHDAKGGKGTPGHVHKIAMPDPFRGIYSSSENALERYGLQVQECLESVQDEGGVAAFIAESVLGCGGQVVLPAGYLEMVYEQVRGQGGLCIADEVQVGFGRVGSHFWAFETQGVIPDIVTLGKPIANGHPMAAVITTREIADAFNNGMEYFNTFGGNPVSCAAGTAVLEVIQNENLQENALRVGNKLLEDLNTLSASHEIVADVRGLGLFIGIELGYWADGFHPLAEQASYIAERMKENGVLVSTDGPDHNVLKIKPPVCFNSDNAEKLVKVLGNVLKEDWAQIQV